MIYTVEVTETALEAIGDQARYIAVECQAPANATRWLEKVWDAIDGLEQLPHRHNLAVESQYKSYSVRRAIVGKHLILFTVDDDAKKVWVIGFRHGSRLPSPDELPDAPPGDY